MEIERKKVMVTALRFTENSLSVIDKYANLSRLYRVVAYIVCFKNNCSARAKKTTKTGETFNLEEIQTDLKQL